MTTAQHSSTLDNGIAVIHSNKLESLLEVVAHWLEVHPLAPLENEVFLVNNNGMGQWLKQNLAQNSALGIAAGFTVKLPATFIWQVYRWVLGDKIPKEQLLAKPALIWRLYRLLPNLVKKTGFEVLGQFLKEDTQSRKRYQLAEQLADLYDQYQVYRSDWLSDWALGHDQLRDAKGEVQILPESQRWQALLWRELLQDLGAENSTFASRASVHAEFMAKIDQSQPKLPKRVIVFGLSTLPQQSLEVLAKISQFCQVVLFVHNPCQHYWADIIEDKDLLKAERHRQSYKDGMSAELSLEALHQFANPLLAAWGKQGRDYLRLLDLFDDQSAYQGWNWPQHKIDLFEDYGQADARSLLQHVQQSILDLEPIASPPVRLSAVDGSLAFHNAHSRQREVEILHDQLLARFNADHSLQPRDVIVMVPDINSYAPHIRAVFGQTDRDDKRYIPFSLVDQQQRGQNPLLNALEVLLRLPESRFEVSEFLGLLEVPALRKKFAIDEVAIPKIQQWLNESGIRWGLDSQQRQDSVAMPENLTANTWHFGLQRLLLGYAVGAGQQFNTIEPYGNIGGLEAQYLGSLASLQALLAVYVVKLRQDYGVVAWSTVLSEMLDDFFEPTHELERKTLATLQQTLQQWRKNCELAKLDLADLLPINIVREAWLSAVDEPTLQQRFLSGRVNFCTLMPMRAIPFKVVCLLGINDGDFPRTQQVQSFDLMGQRGHYRPGDRSRRQDDHYLFLEAVMSARTQLYISWVGRSIRDNTEIPPSVFVSQLRDFLAHNFSLDSLVAEPVKPEKWLTAITVEHPLQPFSPQYIKGDADTQLFTYSHEWFENEGDKEHAGSLTSPIAFEAPKAVTIESLGRFLKAPVKTFCKETLKFSFDDAIFSNEDNEPFGFDSLQTYQQSEDLLTSLKANPTETLESVFSQSFQTMQARGNLPLAGFSKMTFEALTAPVTGAWTQYQALLETWSTEVAPESLSVEVILVDKSGVQVTGHLTEIHQNQAGDLALIRLTAQVLMKDKHVKYHSLLHYWITQVVACASGLVIRTFIVGADIMVEIQPIDQHEAQQMLVKLLTAWHQGLQRPLPVAVKSAFAWLSKQDLSVAKAAYEGDSWNKGEVDYDAYLRRFYPTFETLALGFSEWAALLYTDAFTGLQLVKGAE